MFEQTIVELAHANPEVRYEAARRLGDARDERAVQPLINALPDNNAKVQYAAFSALIKIGASVAAAPMIDALLEDPNSRVWDLLKLNIGMRLRNGLLDMVPRGDQLVADRLTAAIENNSLDEQQRAFVIRLLGRTADTRQVESLIDTLIGDTHLMQGAAAEALGWIRDSRAVSPLLLFLSEGEPSDALRELAAEALGRIGDTHAVEPLIAALEDTNEWVRRAAAESLGMLGDRIAIEPLSLALQDEVVMVQEAAFEALKKLSYGSYTVEL
jgi:HEAT repeat protein